MKETDTLTAQLFAENTKRTNHFAAIAVSVIGFIIAGISLCGQLGLYDLGSEFSATILYVAAGLDIVVWPIGRLIKYDHPMLQHIILGAIIISSGVTFFLYPHSVMFLLYGPMLISCMYYKRGSIHLTAFVSCVVFIIAQALHTHFENTGLLSEYHSFLSIEIYSEPEQLIKVNVIPRILFFIVTAVICDNVAKKGRELLKEQAKRISETRTMEAELNAASEMQRIALPPRSFTAPAGRVKIEAFMRAANAVGGDFYDYFIYDDTLTMVVADVSDKGFPAAMFMVQAKNAVRSAFFSLKDFDKAIQAVNKVLCKDNFGNLFVTMWIGSINIHTGVGKFANCGHNMPIVKHADGTISRIENDPELFMGIFEDAEFHSHILRMQPNDTLVVFTDGMTDEMNSSEESFGEARLVDAVAQMNVDFSDTCDYLVKKVDDYLGGAPQFDDMTVLCASFAWSAVDEKKTLQVAATKEGTESVLDEVNRMLYYVNCPEDVRRNIDVAVDEVCENIRDYALDNEKATYEVFIKVSDNYLEICFADEGEPFNPLEDAEMPELDGLQIGGLGIYLYRTIMDEATYQYLCHRNVLTLTKIWNI